MKRSLLDPLPRQLSTKALAALVALVVCGTGVAVVRFLESGPGAPARSPSAVRAASPADEAPSGEHAPRVLRSRRDSGRTAGPSWTGPSSSLGDTGRCAEPVAKPAACRDSEPTLYRPESTGS